MHSHRCSPATHPPPLSSVAFSLSVHSHECTRRLSSFMATTLLLPVPHSSCAHTTTCPPRRSTSWRSPFESWPRSCPEFYALLTLHTPPPSFAAPVQRPVPHGEPPPGRLLSDHGPGPVQLPGTCAAPGVWGTLCLCLRAACTSCTLSTVSVLAGCLCMVPGPVQCSFLARAPPRALGGYTVSVLAGCLCIVLGPVKCSFLTHAPPQVSGHACGPPVPVVCPCSSGQQLPPGAWDMCLGVRPPQTQPLALNSLTFFCKHATTPMYSCTAVDTRAPLAPTRTPPPGQGGHPLSGSFLCCSQQIQPVYHAHPPAGQGGHPQADDHHGPGHGHEAALLPHLALQVGAGRALGQEAHRPAFSA